MSRRLLSLSPLCVFAVCIGCGQSGSATPGWREVSLQPCQELSPERERMTLSISTREQRDALVLDAARKSGENREYAHRRTHRYAIPGPRDAHISFTPIEHLAVARYCQQDLLAVTFGTSSRESVLPLFESDGLARTPRVWQSPTSAETLVLFELNGHVACASAASGFELIAVDVDRCAARTLAQVGYGGHLLFESDAASITSHGQSELEIRIKVPRDPFPHEAPQLEIEKAAEGVTVTAVSRCEVSIRVH